MFRLLEHWVWLIYSPNWWAKSWGFPLIRCRPSCSFTNSNSCTNSSYICGCNSLLSYSCFGCKSWRYSMTTKSVKILCKIPWRVLWSVLRNLWSQPRAKLVAPLCRYTGVTRKVPFKLRPKDRKDAPLCRYTGVTRKVPFKLRPKDRKKVSIGYWKSVVPRGETKTEETEEQNLRRQSSYSPSENWDCLWLDLFHSCFGTDLRQLCFGGWTKQNHWLLGLLTAVNRMHASSAQVFLSLSSAFPVWA